MRQEFTALVSLSLLALSLTGCGKSMPASPAAPTAINQTASAAAARVSGSVAGATSGLASSSIAGAPAGLTVSVTGTSVTSAVDAAGRFSVNVPPGTIELRFTGPGVDAKVQAGTVSSGDTLEIHVTVTGATADLDNSVQSHDGEREIEGRVEAVPPVTAAGQFKVAGTTITTNPATTYKLNDHTGLFVDIIVGARVHVKGQVSGTGVVATEVNIQSLNMTPPVDPGNGNGNNGGSGSGDGGANGGGNNDNHGAEAEVSGAVTGLAGACPAIRFSIGSAKVVTTASTQFELACGSVTNTTKVEVKGNRASDGTIAATRVKKS